jgi:hypothetical protein
VAGRAPQYFLAFDAQMLSNWISWVNLALIVTLFILIVIAGSNHVESPRGMIVIPGLGRSDRLRTVVHNLLLLASSRIGYTTSGLVVSWDCVVYVYAPRTDEAFWGNIAEISYLASVCAMVENPGKKVTDNLYLAQPALLRRSYAYVFLLLDDCKIQSSNPLSLGHLVEIMHCNNLTVLSPIVRKLRV